MVKIFTLLLLVLFASTASLAQYKEGNTYFRCSFGYNFGIAGSDIGIKLIDTPTTFSRELLHGSFGKGINFSISGGYLLMNNISAEAGYQLIRGTKQPFRSMETGQFSLSSEAYLAADNFRLGGASFQSLKYTDLILIMKFGFILPASRKLVVETIANGNNGPDDHYSTEETQRYSFSFNPGIYAGVGMFFEIDKFFSVYADFELVLHSARFNSSEVTAYKWTHFQDGEKEIRELYNLTVSELNTEYRKEITSSDNIATNPDFDINQATVELTQYLSMNSVSVNVGFFYHLRWKDLIRKKN